MRLTPKNLLLIAALVPVALSGCTSTGTEVSASFAAGEPVLPEVISLEPSPSGEIVAMTSFTSAASAGQAATSIKNAAGARPAKQAATAAEVRTAAAGDGAKVASAADAPNAAASVPPAKAVKPVDAKAKLADGRPTSVAAAPASAAPKGRDRVVKTVAGPSDLAAAALMPASYVKADRPLDYLIAKYAAVYEVPVELVRRVAKRESNFNPSAFNRGHYGLMQIKHATARGMGYRGPARGLFDAETNLKYAVKYLRGAFLVADGNMTRADRLYQTGYYYHAKRKGLLDETGLGRDRERRRGTKPAPKLP